MAGKSTDKTIRLDGEAHKRAKLQATKEGKTLMQWLGELIRKNTKSE